MKLRVDDVFICSRGLDGNAAAGQVGSVAFGFVQSSTGPLM